MEYKYFDGKSSKPYAVTVTRSMNGLQISSSGLSSDVNRYWKYEDITVESFSSGDNLLISHGEWPQERMELSGPLADKIVEDLRDHTSKVNQAYHWITQANPVKLVLGSLFVLSFVVYSYVVYISPFVGEQAVKILPKSVEMKAGEIMYKNMLFSLEVDDQKSEQLLAFYNACGFQSEYDIRIDYSNNDMVNAFAVPGGQIVIFEGLIRETKSWDELAALMGHELAHVNQRHSFKQVARSISSYFLLSVLTGDVAGISSVILENAAQIHQLSNSRSHEKEADLVGLQYLKILKIRPSAMIDFFKRLQESTEEVMDEIKEDIDIDLEDTDGYENRLEYLQTHPTTKNRMKYLSDIITSDPEYQYEFEDNEEAKRIWLELKENIGEESSDIEDIIDTIKDGIGLRKDSTEMNIEVETVN